MQSYLVEMINEQKVLDEKDEKRDLLSNLVNAMSGNSNGGVTIQSDQEEILDLKVFFS